MAKEKKMFQVLVSLHRTVNKKAHGYPPWAAFVVLIPRTYQYPSRERI